MFVFRLILRFFFCICAAVLFNIGVSAYNAYAEAPYGTPVIDGTVDEIWNSSALYEINKVDTTLVPSKTETTGAFRVMWDKTNIYILVTVDKAGVDVHSGFTGAENDSVEFQLTDTGIFDGVNNMCDDKSTLVGIFRVDSSGASSGSGGGYLILKNDFCCAYKQDDDDKYTVEIAIPFFNVKPTAGHLFSLEIQINVNDSGNGRDGIVTWASSECLGWRDSSAHGAVLLLEEVSAETSAEDSNPVSPPSSDMFLLFGIDAVFCAVFSGTVLVISKKRRH